MKIINKNQILLEYDTELIALETMLEDLPHYLSLNGVNLSAISEANRKELLGLIKKIDAKRDKEE